MSSSDDHCRLDKNVEKLVEKQLSKRLWSDLFKISCKFDAAHDWSMMLVEILEQISDRLPLLDLVRFRSVCRQWRSSSSSRAELFNFSKDQPWLILYDLDKKKTGIPKCYVYSQSRSQCCTFKLYDIEGATIVKSKFDWVLAHHDDSHGRDSQSTGTHQSRSNGTIERDIFSIARAQEHQGVDRRRTTKIWGRRKSYGGRRSGVIGGRRSDYKSESWKYFHPGRGYVDKASEYYLVKMSSKYNIFDRQSYKESEREPLRPKGPTDGSEDDLDAVTTGEEKSDDKV
ncbi:uncharacterized protein A4U43_C04F32060 [Asparagus officinalis]|uniref:F-box domain-containing protein n=1 Tax=Asparagus officinalis TaxID=4686 RepID=A0A5P1F532_ASPOF|nr:uncharacterized protein A4U43_C04F32060 [Asparagus officinalis]